MDEHEEQLFEPFQRLDDHGPEGVGLGLSVARGFIEAMDGAMVADDTRRRPDDANPPPARRRARANR